MKQYIKYPRTFHLPWSEGITDDDKVLKNISHFIDKEIVVSEKMDGENTTMYKDFIHARSIDSKYHPSRSWVNNFWASIAHLIPDGWRICGENLYAVHSIHYNNLKSYFYGFSVWNNYNECLSWDETITFFNNIGIIHVPVLYRGMFDEKIIKSLWSGDLKENGEGYVVRCVDSFKYDEFNKNVAKFVRSNHVQTDTHWMHTKIKRNSLCSI
jgi:ATP-dependent RNA circularization protein (DNA/RNA ligase family)